MANFYNILNTCYYLVFKNVENILNTGEYPKTYLMCRICAFKQLCLNVNLKNLVILNATPKKSRLNDHKIKFLINFTISKDDIKNEKECVYLFFTNFAIIIRRKGIAFLIKSVEVNST